MDKIQIQMEPDLIHAILVPDGVVLTPRAASTACTRPLAAGPHQGPGRTPSHQSVSNTRPKSWVSQISFVDQNGRDFLLDSQGQLQERPTYSCSY